MTNFEKWRQTIRIVDLIEYNGSRIALDCGRCPARNECTDSGLKCREAFERWANKEAK